MQGTGDGVTGRLLVVIEQLAELGDGQRLAGSHQRGLDDLLHRLLIRRGGAGFNRLDGVVVADSWLDLVDGTLDAPIVIDEYGDLIGDVPVFTNTTIFGTPISLDTDCEGWTTIDFFSKTYQGTSGETDERWTDYLPNPTGCDTNGHLYCFEQD